MSNENRVSRRSVIKKGSILLGGVGLASGSAYAKPTNGPNTDFHPNVLKDVKQFVADTFADNQDPFQQLQRWGETGEKDQIFKSLSEDQKRALLDSVRPSIFVAESFKQHPRNKKNRSAIVNSSADNRNSQAIQASVDKHSNPIEKWGWDTDVVREDLKSNSVLRASAGDSTEFSTSLGTKSATTSHPRTGDGKHYEHVYARAVSFDWKAYEFTGRLYWNYSFGESSNPSAITSVGDTNSTTWHVSTDKEVAETNHTVVGDWEVTFKNGMAKVCAPYVGWPCVELASEFKPYMTLEGYSNGSGQTIDKGDDALDGDFILG
ncbi:MAG: hypothetical protein V5A34_08465 [Halapricum sp.]